MTLRLVLELVGIWAGLVGLWWLGDHYGSRLPRWLQTPPVEPDPPRPVLPEWPIRIAVITERAPQVMSVAQRRADVKAKAIAHGCLKAKVH